MLKILLYPDNWQEIAHEIKDANDWACQECGIRCRRPGELNLGWRFLLTVAHYDQDYDGAEVFCCCLCLACHFRHDAPFVWWARRRHARLRGQLAGQLALAL